MYTPLFAPIAVPTVVGLLKELIGWWRRRKGKAAAEKTAGEEVKKETAEAKEGQEEEEGEAEVGERSDGKPMTEGASQDLEEEKESTAEAEVRVLRSRLIVADG